MRLDALTGLRWWAAFGVFMFHMRFMPLPGLGSIAKLGDYGVMFFFVLSGFVLTLSATPGTKASTFYWRRFSRIWPANFVALLLAIPVFYSFSPDPAHWWVKAVSIPVLLLSIPIIQGWWRDPTILFSGNPASWTLSCEFFFYALHPAINGALRKANLRVLLGVGLGVFALGLAYNAFSLTQAGAWTAQVPLPVARLNEFVLGMIIAAAVRLGYLTKIPSWVAFVAFGIFTISLAAITGYKTEHPLAHLLVDYSPTIMVLLFSFMIGVVASKNARGKKSVLQWRPLVILGEWSFAFYLVHGTCIYFVRDFIGPRSASWTNLGWYAIIFVFALSVAGALHLWVERPIEKRLRSWWDARRAVTA
jgi:peptidoglycan/LPS O-acetylase OafA/YrhL